MPVRSKSLLLLWVALLVLLQAGPMSSPVAAALPVLRVRVTGPGVVSLSGSQLVQAGWSGVDPRTIQVRRGRVELPVEVTGQDDGRLDGGDQVRWLAGDGSRWSLEEVYTLGAGASPGVRGALATDAPVRWQEDTVYLPSATTERGDRWFGRELRSPGSAATLTLTLPSPLPIGQTIELSVSALRARAHRLSAQVYNSTLGTAEWTSGPADLGQSRTVTFTTLRPLPAGPQTLSLQVEGMGSADLVLVDRVSIPGLRVPLPVLSPVLEAVPSPALPVAADYLIVTHSTFRSALDPLIAARQAQGLKVAVVDVEDAYTLFTGGERNPEAIRLLLRASRQWSPAPRSLLIVGGGSARVRAAGPDGGFIPPYLIDADPELGEIPCDTCLARLDGEDARLDLLPELAVGRFPALTLDEARSMVAKSLTNLTPPSGVWARTVLGVSDNDVEANGVRDPAASFVEELEGALRHVPATSQVRRFLYDPTKPTSAQASSYRTPAELRQALFPAFDQGAGLVVYAGHASPWQWAFTGPNIEPAYLFSVYDVARANGGRLPFLLDLTCLSGQWSNPARRALDELLVVQPNGGVVAALAPAGTAINTGHRLLADATMPALVAGQTAGEAHLAGLRAVAAAGSDRDLLFSYNLLGDPEVRLPRPSSSGKVTVYLPLVRR